MSQDTFNGTPAKFIKTISQHMDATTDIGNIIVIDNTNGIIKTREKYISLAHNKGYKVMVIYFNTPKEICMHLNALRTKINNIYTELNTIPSSIKDDKDDKGDNKKDGKDDNDDSNSNVPAVAIHTYWKKLEIPDKKENMNELFTIYFEPIFPKTKTNYDITKELFSLFL